LPSFTLGERQYRALDGNIYSETIQIKRETAKAVLLSVEKHGKNTDYWIPKACCKIHSGKIAIADWFWEKEVSK
jgi:hypothetical protein